jgi:hypothetical protein
VWLAVERRSRKQPLARRLSAFRNSEERRRQRGEKGKGIEERKAPQPTAILCRTTGESLPSASRSLASGDAFLSQKADGKLMGHLLHPWQKKTTPAEAPIVGPYL